MGPVNPPELFRRLSIALERASIPYMVTGSFAATVYGMGRSTPDIDLIICADEKQVRRLLDLLPQNGFYSDRSFAIEACRRQSTFNVIDEVTGLKIDFIFRKPRAFSEQEFQRRKSALVEGMQFFIVSAEDLIVATLECVKMGSPLRQMEDVIGILKVRKDELDFVHIDQWVKEMGLSLEWQRARAAAGFNSATYQR